MNNLKILLIFVVAFNIKTMKARRPPQPPVCDGRRSSSITRASYNERIKINELIEKIDFDCAVVSESISTLTTHGNFHLDNEVSREVSTGDVAEFRIKSGEKTYGEVLLRIGKTFGKMNIKQLFIKSVFCGQIFFLR